MKTTEPSHAAQPASTNRIALHSLRCTLAAISLLFSACSALIVHPQPSAQATQRNGQVKFASTNEKIVGDIVIRYDERNFLAEITKGPGVPLLTLSAEFGSDPRVEELKERHMLVVRATGPLSHGGWTWKPKSLTKKSYSSKKLQEPSKAWAALPEVFMWGDSIAKGTSFRVCLPDIVMHARTGRGEVRRFDYNRHENATEGPLTLKDLKRQPVLEGVICHLDK